MGIQSLSGSGMRSTGVNYATAYMFDRMYWSLQGAPHVRRGAQVLAVTYQANTGASGGSLKRAAQGIGWNNIRYK
jgi:hypothetical protein